MATKSLQIVSFDNPFPSDYGGVIDVFYKIKALYRIGVEIHLHAFYDDRVDVSGLKSLCKSITLYKRDKSLTKHFSLKPYGVNSRVSKALVVNLNKMDCPVLFESIVSTDVLEDIETTKKISVRCHNIEHHYSLGLAKSERSFVKKLAFYIESFKLKLYQKKLQKADVLLTLSNFETDYFEANFNNEIAYLPVFQAFNDFEQLSSKGDYAFYHGDLNISDNIKSALFMVDVFSVLNHKLIIASSILPKALKKEIDTYNHITFKLIENKDHLVTLLSNAHINTLYSFQRSGTKLKLFNSLFKGRHCIVNTNIADDDEVLSCCEIAQTKDVYREKVNMLFEQEFQLTQKRKDALQKYNTIENAKKLIQLIS